MCFLLTVAVASKHADRIAKTFARGFQTRITTNSSVVSSLPAGFVARTITTGGCSCDLYSRSHGTSPSNSGAHLQCKYARRGWSENKTARAVEQALESRPTPPSPGLRSDVVERLQDLCRFAGTVAVVVHWYGGDAASEPLLLTQADPCTRAQLPTRAAELREDVVLIATDRGAA